MTINNPSEAAKAVVRRNTEEVQGGGNFDVFDELFADDFLDHTPQPGRTPDKAGARELYRILRAAFPDFHADINWQIADGDRVTTYETYHGTHQGQIGPAIGFCWPCRPAISSSLSRSLNTFAARASRFSWTLIVHSTMSSSPIAVSFRWSRFTRMAASLRWQRSVGRVARVFKSSSGPRVPPFGLSSKSRGAQERCRARPSHEQ
jgi:SnoaL-like polyketide cyclase